MIFFKNQSFFQVFNHKKLNLMLMLRFFFIFIRISVFFLNIIYLYINKRVNKKREKTTTQKTASSPKWKLIANKVSLFCHWPSIHLCQSRALATIERRDAVAAHVKSYSWEQLECSQSRQVVDWTCCSDVRVECPTARDRHRPSRHCECRVDREWVHLKMFLEIRNVNKNTNKKLISYREEENEVAF